MLELVWTWSHSIMFNVVQEIIHWSQNLPLQIAISIVASMSVMSHKHLQVPSNNSLLCQTFLSNEFAAILKRWICCQYLWLFRISKHLSGALIPNICGDDIWTGPERELDQLPVFGELLALLPSKNIHIEFVGPAVPDMRYNYY